MKSNINKNGVVIFNKMRPNVFVKEDEELNSDYSRLFVDFGF